ncbi:MAG: RodZ domain-containing protein [Parcubacteria group bacterium]|jgi:transcriptional regulator with XRE-family HTH domain
MVRGFTQKKVNSYTLGEQLKKIRSEGRISLLEISRETKIPVRYLTMIEEGDYNSLPPDVYVKGFLRGYAEYLGAEPKKLISLYEREKDIKNNLKKDGEIEVVSKKDRVPRFIITPKIITAAVIVIIVLGGFFYLYKEIGRFAAEPRLVITDPVADKAVEGNSVNVIGFTDQDAKLAINDQPVMVNDEGEFQENILLQDGMNAITISSTNRFGKSVSKTLNINSDYQKPDLAYEPDLGSGGEGKVDGEQNESGKGVEVTVRADSLPTWLSVESDGDLVYSGTMLPGATQDFRGEKEIRITSGKADQTFIRVNGKDEKILADNPGIVRDVVFTPGD